MKSLEKIKNRYVGKWIALSDGKVVAVNSDYHELHNDLKEKNFKEIYVVYSPSPEDKRYETML